VRRIYHPVPVDEAPRPQRLQARHDDAAAYSRAKTQAETPGATEQVSAPVRVQKMPGRNDLCWCGSGKKYKHCHMKADLDGGNGQGRPASQPEGAKKVGVKAKKR
jgi:hypothetical protein